MSIDYKNMELANTGNSTVSDLTLELSLQGQEVAVGWALMRKAD